MRKLFSLGVLALLLSVLSSPVVAAVEHCETLKGGGGSKGLYGMCIAYWNSVSNHDDGGLQSNRIEDSNRFLDRYNAIRDRVGGPEMPGLEDDAPENFECLCWSDLTAEDVGESAPAALCMVDDTSGKFMFDWLTYVNADNFQSFRIDSNGCAYIKTQTGQDEERFEASGLSGPQDQKCRMELRVIAEVDWGYGTVDNTCTVYADQE